MRRKVCLGFRVRVRVRVRGLRLGIGVRLGVRERGPDPAKRYSLPYMEGGHVEVIRLLVAMFH